MRARLLSIVGLALASSRAARPVTTSETTHPWSALAIRSVTVPMPGACVFTAGSSSTPAGSFVLHLEAIDVSAATAHGSLALILFVLPRTTEQGMQSDCGPGTTEHVDLRF